LKNRIDKIVALIERCCKKKLVFAHPLLPFGTVREAYAHCTHLFAFLIDFIGAHDFQLQIAQADAQTKICKNVLFSSLLLPY
jgi:hypothetical protein